VIAIVSVVLLKMKSVSKPSPALESYVLNLRKKGYSDMYIGESLRKAGYSEDDIQGVLKK